MAIEPFLTDGLGNGTFNGNITQLLLTGLISGEAAAAADEGAAWFILAHAIPNKGVR